MEKVTHQTVANQSKPTIQEMTIVMFIEVLLFNLSLNMNHYTES